LKAFSHLASSTNKEYPEYLSELSEHYFCLCPRGNGLDSHRFWESLYLGVIPVIVNNSHTSSKNFVDYLKKFFGESLPFVEITSDDLESVKQMKFSEEEYLKIFGRFSFWTSEKLKSSRI